MKKMNIKWLFNTIIIIAAVAVSSVAYAGNNVNPAAKENGMFELTRVGKDKVAITCNLEATGTEYYEIERSENNAEFKTIGIVFPATASEKMRNGISLKDNVASQKVMYYRLKKVNGNTVTYTEAKAISL